MIHTKKVAFYTLGCKLNFSETSTIARQFLEAGYARVDFEEQPDVFVINTCSVTENADKKCRTVVKNALKINAEADVVIIGCYAQLKPAQIAAIPGVDLVLGANEKFNVIAHLDSIDKADRGKYISEEIKNTKTFIPSYSIDDRTRTFFKVQDGCNYFCAFCTIPLARGRSRSATLATTLKEAQTVAKTQAREVVLTGVNIGDFGTPNGESFFDLVEALDDTEGIDRFRISSIEPNLLEDRIIDFVAQSKRFVPHFHVPLQSGSDAILKAMRRRYLSGLYADRVSRIKSQMPNACIGVDVIVGFPGETEEEFLTTYNFLNDLDVSYFHVFTYSERDNTTALRIKETVPMAERQRRSKMLRILSLKKKRAFYQSQLGKTYTVLWEGENSEDFMFGFTENYVKVRRPYAAKLVNTLEKVTLKSIDSEGIVDISTPVTTTA